MCILELWWQSLLPYIVMEDRNIAKRCCTTINETNTYFLSKIAGSWLATSYVPYWYWKLFKYVRSYPTLVMLSSKSSRTHFVVHTSLNNCRTDQRLQTFKVRRFDVKRVEITVLYRRWSPHRCPCSVRKEQVAIFTSLTLWSRGVKINQLSSLRYVKTEIRCSLHRERVLSTCENF